MLGRSRCVQVTWESLVYSDGSIYQGLAQQGKAQGRGGLLYANGDTCVALRPPVEPMPAGA
jgi:hypothetical protein